MSSGTRMTILENVFFSFAFGLLIPLLASMLPVTSIQSDEEPMDGGIAKKRGGIRNKNGAVLKGLDLDLLYRVDIYFLFNFFFTYW